MNKRRLRVAIGAAVLIAAAGALVPAISAPAASGTTLTCTALSGQTMPPLGCGGYQSAYTAKGIQDLAVTGNFYNAPLVSALDSISNGDEDFMAFAVGGSTTSGEGLGRYVIVSTPFGRLPGFAVQPAPGSTFAMNSGDFCVSVSGERIGPKHSIRAAVVLRPCILNGLFTYGTGTLPGSVSPGFADPYQVWAPAQGPYGLVMVNEALTHGFYHGNVAWVLDLQGAGPPGSRFIAYPDNNGRNQNGLILGCTPPITNIVAQLPVPPVGVTYALCP